MGLSAFQCAMEGRTEHAPTSDEYPETIVKRTSFESGGGFGWKISGLWTPRETPAEWKIVVVTGAPSWAEYWAPTLAALPVEREMLVVDRPGFANSEPFHCVPDIRTQAEALLPALDAAPGQRVLLVGQSYGAAIATLMAAANPGKVAGVVLLSGYFGEFGRTSRFLVKLGSRLFKIIPRDIRHGIMEVTGQAPQLGYFKDALSRLRVPVHILHGEKDDYAPLEAAEKLVREVRTRRPVRFERLANADHFPQDSQPQALWEALQRCVPQRRTLNLMEMAKEKLAPRSAANAA